MRWIFLGACRAVNEFGERFEYDSYSAFCVSVVGNGVTDV